MGKAPPTIQLVTNCRLRVRPQNPPPIGDRRELPITKICYIVTSMTIRDSYALLTLEGHLVQASLTHGLTALRAANIHQKGTFYSAFFHLSIGLERLMKVILIIDHMASNSMNPPSDRLLRKHGHDLVTLFDYLLALPDPKPNPLDRVDRTAIPFQILTFLSGFAKHTRYYNLDSLVDSPSAADPLYEWHDIIAAILSVDITAKQKRKAEERGMAMIAATWDKALVIGQNLDGTPMTLSDAALLPQVHDLAARHAVFHVLEVVQSLKDILDYAVDHSHHTARSLGTTECPVPYMTEFLDFFCLDKKLILGKKRWP